MAEVGNSSMSAKKRREMSSSSDSIGHNSGDSPMAKKLKMDDDTPPEANPNTIEGVRDKNREMWLDLLEKNRRIAFLTQKCESLFRQSAVSDSAFRCMQRQWLQLLDDLGSASDALGKREESARSWLDIVSQSESLGVLRLPRDAVTLALPEWFLSVSRGDQDAELPASEDMEEEPMDVTCELMSEREKLVEKELLDERKQVQELLAHVLAAVSDGSTKTIAFEQLVADKREATAQVLALKDDFAAMKRTMIELQHDLEYKEAERHQACRNYDRLRQYMERNGDSEASVEAKQTAKESKEAITTDSAKQENGSSTQPQQHQPQHEPKVENESAESVAKLHAMEKRLKLMDAERKQANADKMVLLDKLKDERLKTESMRSDLNRLHALETAWKHEEVRLRQEFDAQIERLQNESVQNAEAQAASRVKEDDAKEKVQDVWRAQLVRVQEETAKTKSKMNELVFKNTALRDKLASFSAYRDQLSDLKSQHESLKRETERVKEQLQREKARHGRDAKADECKQVVELREKVALAEKQRDDLQHRADEIIASQSGSSDEKLSIALAGETKARQDLEELRVQHSRLTVESEKLRIDLESAVANQEAFKDENDALVTEIGVLNKEVESVRHSKKKVLKQVEEKRQSAKKMQAELAKETNARAHSSEELANVRLQVSSLTYVHSQQKAALEAAKEVEKATRQELDDLKHFMKVLQKERDTVAEEKIKAEKEAEAAQHMFKSEAAYKQRQVLQDKSRPCERCETYRKKVADYEKRIAALRSSNGTASSGNTTNTSNGEPSSALTELERFELKDLQKQLKCSVCQDRHKDVIISKCYHMFCKECVDSNLKSRNRKCPTCKKMFGQDDVKSVWFA